MLKLHFFHFFKISNNDFKPNTQYWAFDFLHESYTTLRKYLVEIVGKSYQDVGDRRHDFSNVMNTIALIESNDMRLAREKRPYN